MGKLILGTIINGVGYLSIRARILKSLILFAFDACQGTHVMKSEKRLGCRRTRKNMNLGFSVRYEGIFLFSNYGIVSS